MFIGWDYPTCVLFLHSVHMGLGEYLLIFEEGGRTPTALSDHQQGQSWLLAPFYNGYDIIWCYG